MHIGLAFLATYNSSWKYSSKEYFVTLLKICHNTANCPLTELPKIHLQFNILGLMPIIEGRIVLGIMELLDSKESEAGLS